jgi:putative nucleotidyltransferase with HDIG domain
MALGSALPQTSLARSLARGLLEGLPDRWLHTVSVARRAAELAVTVPPADRDTLVVAAWLHDIGYSPAVADTGFHALDGARYLDRHGWPPRVSALVAHHSGADLLAGAQGLRQTLDRYPDERSPTSDALAYADQTVGPAGQPLPIRDRIAEASTRHGPGSAHARVRRRREPFLRAVGERVERRLRAVAAHRPGDDA